MSSTLSTQHDEIGQSVYSEKSLAFIETKQIVWGRWPNCGGTRNRRSGDIYCRPLHDLRVLQHDKSVQIPDAEEWLAEADVVDVSN